MIDFMKASYEIALNAGMSIVSLDTAARIMAVVNVHGNKELSGLIYSGRSHS